MKKQGCEQLTLFPGGSPASRLVWPGSEEARQMTVISGRKCAELSKNSGPLGLLEKTLLESSAWHSTRRLLTWKTSATPAGRLLFRLAPSMPRTDGTESPLWPTPTRRDYKGANSLEHLTREGQRNHTDQLANAVKLFPTPTRFDATCGDLRGKEYDGKTQHAMKLTQAAQLFPTPTGRSWKSMSQAETRQGGPDLQTEIGGQLNPTWVEWLMGFPVGWTDLNASATP